MGISNVSNVSVDTLSNRSTKQTEKAAEEFAGIMNMASFNAESVQNIKIDKDAEKSGAIDETSKTDYVNRNHRDESVDNDSKSKDDVENEKIDDSKEADDSKVDSSKDGSNSMELNNVDDNPESQGISTQEEVVAVSEEIISVISELTGLSSEQIVEAMTKQEITFSDFTNPETLKDFALSLTDTTEVDMLINEDASGMIGKLMKEVETILQNTDADVMKQLELVELVNVNDISDDISIMNDIYDDLNSGTKKIDSSVDSLSANNANILEKSLQQVNSEEMGSQTGSNMESQQNSFTDSQAGETSTQTIVNIATDVNQVVVDVNALEPVNQSVDVSELDIINQIIEKVKAVMTKETTSLEVQLYPEHLGKVQITVAQRNGIMQAQIVTETEAAKNAIENNLTMLKDNFNNQELKVESVEVMVSTHDFNTNSGDNSNQSKNQQKASRTMNKGLYDDEMISVDDIAEQENLRARGSNVSYTA